MLPVLNAIYTCARCIWVPSFKLDENEERRRKPPTWTPTPKVGAGRRGRWRKSLRDFAAYCALLRDFSRIPAYFGKYFFRSKFAEYRTRRPGLKIEDDDESEDDYDPDIIFCRVSSDNMRSVASDEQSTKRPQEKSPEKLQVPNPD